MVLLLIPAVSCFKFLIVSINHQEELLSYAARVQPSTFCLPQNFICADYQMIQIDIKLLLNDASRSSTTLIHWFTRFIKDLRRIQDMQR